MMKFFKNSKITILSILCAGVVALVGVLTTAHLININKDDSKLGQVDTTIVASADAEYDDYLRLVLSGADMEEGNHYFSFKTSSSSDKENLGVNDDMYTINCDYLTIDNAGNVMYGMDGVISDLMMLGTYAEKNNSPSNFKLQVQDDFNINNTNTIADFKNGVNSKFVKFQLDPIKGYDYNKLDAYTYYISQIVVKYTDSTGSVFTLQTINGVCKEGVISYSGKDLSLFGDSYISTYNMNTENASYFFKFVVDQETGRLDYTLTTANGGQLKHNFEFDIRVSLKDKVQDSSKNKIEVTKNGTSIFLNDAKNNENNNRILTISDGTFFGGQLATFNNPANYLNNLNCYTTDDLINVNLTTAQDILTNKMLNVAQVGSFVTGADGKKTYKEWFSMYGGVYGGLLSDKRFYFNSTITNTLVNKGVLKSVTETLDTDQENGGVYTNTYYKLSENYSVSDDVIEIEKNKSVLILNGYNTCVYIEYSDDFVALNQQLLDEQRDITFNALADYYDGGVIVGKKYSCTNNLNQYTKFELVIFNDGRIRLDKTDLERSMYVNFTTQNFFVFSLMSKQAGGTSMLLSGIPYDKVYVRVKSGSTQILEYDFVRSAESGATGRTDAKVGTFFAGVSNNEFSYSTNIVLGKNYLFDESNGLDSSLLRDVEVNIGGELQKLKLQYLENNAFIGSREFIGRVNSDNLTDFVLKINLKLLRGSNETNFNMSGTTITTSGQLMTGSVLSPTAIGSGFNNQTTSNYTLTRTFSVEKLADGSLPFVKLKYNIGLPAGYVLAGGRYRYTANESNSSWNAFDYMGYSINQNDVGIDFLGVSVDEAGVVIANNSVLEIDVRVMGISIELPLYVQYDSDLYENTDEFKDRIKDLTEAINDNLKVTDVASLKVGKSGNGLYKQVGNIKLQVETVNTWGISVKNVSVYYKEFGAGSEYKKLDLSNLPKKDGYAFLGVYTSLEGLSNGKDAGIAHMGNTSHDKLTDSNLISTIGARLVIEKSTPKYYELFIDGQFFEKSGYDRYCKNMERASVWEEAFNLCFKKVKGAKVNGRIYASSNGLVSVYNGVDNWGEEGDVYLYELNMDIVQKVTTFEPMRYYFDDLGYSSMYTGANDSDWKDRYCRNLTKAKNNYSYKGIKSSKDENIELLLEYSTTMGKTQRFFKYTELDSDELLSQWDKVFYENFVQVDSAVAGDDSVIYVTTTGKTSLNFESGKYCYILQNARSTNVYFANFEGSEYMYLNKLDAFVKNRIKDDVHTDFVVAYTMFDALCNEKKVVLKDYNYVGQEGSETPTEINIVAEGYVYTDTNFLVVERLVYEQRLYKIGSTTSVVEIAVPFSGGRIEYGKYPVDSKDYALELYPIATPEYIAKGKRIYYFTTSKTDFDSNKNSLNASFVPAEADSRYFMNENYLSVDRKRVEDNAVYHLKDYYKDGDSGKTWYVVPTSINYEFSIVGTDAERRVELESETRINYADKGNYEIKYVDKIPYGASITDLISGFVGVSASNKPEIGRFSGNLLGVFDEASLKREVPTLKLRGYDLVGLIPFSADYVSQGVQTDAGFDNAVYVNVEFIKNYFGVTDSEAEALIQNYYTQMESDSALQFDIVMEALERLTKTEYFKFVKRVSVIYGVHQDKLTNAMLVEAFLNENELKGLSYTRTGEEGDYEEGMFAYHTALVGKIIDGRVSKDFLNAQRFISLEFVEGSKFADITILRQDGEGRIACEFNYCRDIVFIPVFASKNSDLKYDGNGKAFLDNKYLDSENNRVEGVYGQNIKLMTDPDTGEQLGYEHFKFSNFSVSAIGYKTGGFDEGSLDPISELNSVLRDIADRLKSTIRINKRVRVDDIKAISVVPKDIQSGFYACGINLILNKGTMYESSIRIIDFELKVDGERRVYEYIPTFNSQYFVESGDYYMLKDGLTADGTKTFGSMAGFVYSSADGYIYWDMLESVDFRLEYTPFKYNISFGATSEEDENESKDITTVGMIVNNDFSSESFDTGVYKQDGIKIGEFINLTDTIYGGSNVYVFNTLKFVRPVISDRTKVYSEGEYNRYLSNGVFIKTILVEYTSLFGDPTVKHTGIQFTIKTDRYGLPQVVEKQIVKVVVAEDGSASFESEEITPSSVGEAIFEALNYDFMQDVFTFDIEALSNADNSISSINFKFVYDYKSYVLSFNAGLYHITNFDAEGKIEPLDPTSITENSTKYYLVKYNTRNDPKTWIPSNEEGVPTGEEAGFSTVQMLGSGGIIDFNSFTLERIVEITTSFDKKPRFFAYWVRDVRGADYLTPTGDIATYEELGIYDVVLGEDGNPLLDGEGNPIWQIPNVFDSESGGSFDYYTLFMDEADINVYYYTWNNLKNVNSQNGYTRTAHKGYFFGKAKEYKDFFTVNAYEYYTFGNSNEKYYILGWLKVYDNILTKLDAEGNVVLDEFALYYFLHQEEQFVIGDVKMNKFVYDQTGGAIFVPALDDASRAYTLMMNQKFSVKKRDTVDENLGAINIYMYAIYAKVDFDITENKVVSGESETVNSLDSTAFVPNTVEMGNIRGNHQESDYQFATFEEKLGKLNSVTNAVVYWAKINYFTYSDLYGKYFTIKDMLNSGELAFEILKDDAGIPITGKINMSDVMAKLNQGEVLVAFYSRLPEITIVDEGILIDGSKSDIIAGAIMVGTRGTDKFLFKQFKELNLNADGTVVGTLDSVVPLEVGTEYYTAYINAVNSLRPIKDKSITEYKKREVLVRTALQLAKWNADTTKEYKYRFRFADNGSFNLDLANADDITKLNDLITKMSEIKGTNEKVSYININSASFVRLVYAIASISFAKVSGVDPDKVYYINTDSGQKYFNAENTLVLNPDFKPNAGETPNPNEHCMYDKESVGAYYYTEEDEQNGEGIFGGLKDTNLIAGDICTFTKTDKEIVVNEDGEEVTYEKTTYIFAIYLGISINTVNNTNSVYIANNNSIGGLSVSRPANGCSLGQLGFDDQTRALTYLAGVVDVFNCTHFIRVYGGETI